jgi:hypothetical protein
MSDPAAVDPEEAFVASLSSCHRCPSMLGVLTPLDRSTRTKAAGAGRFVLAVGE